MKAERVVAQKPDLSERSSSNSIHQAAKIIIENDLYGQFEIADSREKEYLLATLAWDIKRKKGREISFLSNHPQIEFLRRRNGIANWIAAQVSKIDETEKEAVQILDELRVGLRNSSPSLTYISPVIDRASNIISAHIIQAQEQHLSVAQAIESQRFVIDRFRQEIATARQHFLQTSPT